MKHESDLKKAIFLDRDGTLNIDPGYISDPEVMKLIPGVGEALSQLKRAGFVLVVVSNQSGVARGLIPEDALPKINGRLNELLRPWGVEVDHFELCLHHPDEDCECRKPKAKLIIDSARKLGIDLSRSYMVGDRGSDIEAGINARCRGSILVRTGDGKGTEEKLDPSRVAFIGNSLRDAAEWILGQEMKNPGSETAGS